MAVRNPFSAKEIKYFKNTNTYIIFEYKGHKYLTDGAMCIRPKCAEDIDWLNVKIGKEPVVNESTMLKTTVEGFDLENGYEVVAEDFTLTDIKVLLNREATKEVNYTLFGKNYSTLFNSDYVMALFRFSDKVIITIDKYTGIILCGLDKDNVLTGFCFPVQSDKHTHKLKKFVRG